MVLGLLIITLASMIAVASHRWTRLQEKIIKNVPFNLWLEFLVYPLMFYVSIYLMMRNVINRGSIDIIALEDIDIIFIMYFFLISVYIALTLHFASKVLWGYLKKNPNTMVYRINEMFHGKLSHYLAYMNSFFFTAMIPIIEMNHPLIYPLDGFLLDLVIVFAIIFGFSACKAVFYTNEWYGGYNRPLFIVALFLLTILIVTFRSFHLKYAYYPMSLFVHISFTGIIVTMIVRQAMIFTRLNNKQRLRFLTKMFSAQ